MCVKNREETSSRFPVSETSVQSQPVENKLPEMVAKRDDGVKRGTAQQRSDVLTLERCSTEPPSGTVKTKWRVFREQIGKSVVLHLSPQLLCWRFPSKHTGKVENPSEPRRFVFSHNYSNCFVVVVVFSKTQEFGGNKRSRVTEKTFKSTNTLIKNTLYIWFSTYITYNEKKKNTVKGSRIF